VCNAARLALCVLLAAAAAVPARADEPRLRDPMQPFKAVAGAAAPGGTVAPRFRLTAVLISPTRRVAIVNGAPRQEGERVAGATLTRIEPQAVRLEQGAETWVIHLGQAADGAPRTEGASVQ
jgi:MSHA biogenesis protein MshK